MSIKFLSMIDLTEYEGKWVTMVNDRIVCSGEDEEAVLSETRSRYPGRVPFLVKIPTRVPMVV